MNREEVQRKAQDFGGQVIASSATYVAEDHLRRHGREIWKYLLLLIVGLLGIEIFFQQRFSGVKS